MVRPYGNYRHDWDLGEMSLAVTAIKAMAILQSRPNDVFPFLEGPGGGDRH